MLCLVREGFKVEHSGVFCAANCLNTGSLMKSTVSTTNLWNSAQLALLNGILAQLIPSGANGTIPSAAEFGVADFVAQKVSDKPDLQLLFTQGLEYLETLLKSSEKAAAELSNEEWIALVSQLEKSQPSFLKCSSELPTWVTTASQQFDHFLVCLRLLPNQKDIWCRQTIQ